MMSNVYRRSNTFLSVCLSAFLLCFGSHCTISIVRVRMTLTGGRRFFLLRFFSQTKFTFSLLFFFSRSFTRSFTMTRCEWMCVRKKRNLKYWWCNYNFSIFYFKLQTDQYIYMYKAYA
jgi:hypothetical protein